MSSLGDMALHLRVWSARWNPRRWLYGVERPARPPSDCFPGWDHRPCRTTTLYSRQGRIAQRLGSVFAGQITCCRHLREGKMRVEDMILVSCDDHVIEPPDMFERH